MSEARTEDATPRQERRARERGRAWQSRDLALGAVLVVGGGMLHVGASPTRNALIRLFTDALDGLAHPIDPRVALEHGVLAGARLALPLLCAAVAVGALVSAVQVGGLFAPAAVAPDAARLDPSSRGGSGARVGSTLLLGTARLALLLAVAAWTCANGIPGIATLSRQLPGAALDACFTMASALTLRCGMALVAFGTIDAIVERALFRASLRMTRREREREQREAEGDAHLRRERARVRETLHREGELAEVRSATLIVTGEGLAIALSYDETDPDAVPHVSAIARELESVALSREAEEYGVSVVEDDTLATELAIVPVGAVIPEALYAPVARAMHRGGRG